jgi:hypothetical protein
MNKTNTADARRTFRLQVEALITAASSANLIGFQHVATAALLDQSWAMARMAAAIAKLAGKRRTQKLVLSVIRETDVTEPSGSLAR